MFSMSNDELFLECGAWCGVLLRLVLLITPCCCCWGAAVIYQGVTETSFSLLGVENLRCDTSSFQASNVTAGRPHHFKFIGSNVPSALVARFGGECNFDRERTGVNDGYDGYDEEKIL